MCPYCKRTRKLTTKIDDEIRGVKENHTVKTERDWEKTERQSERWSGMMPIVLPYLVSFVTGFRSIFMPMHTRHHNDIGCLFGL